MTKPVRTEKISGRMTGIETQGDLAGEIVCPIINLWKVNDAGDRHRLSARIPHDTPVFSDRYKYDATSTKMIFVVQKGKSRIRGWVTERFFIAD